MKDRVVAKCPEIKDKISVIHNWADPNQIVPIAKHQNWFAKAFNLVDTFTVLYSGNMGRCHDMETILAAAKLLKDQPIQFVFIGNGAKREGFRAQASQLGLHNCQFLPYQDKQNLPYSLTACDLSLVSVSPGMEGLVAPSKLYAALAAGRPLAIICEPHSYLRAMLQESGCGEAFSNGDAEGLAAFIRRLAADSPLTKQMGQAGRRYLQSNFTPDLIAQQYSQVLCEAAGEAMESFSSRPIEPITGQSVPLHK
jgi:glycosyltransferase involved in cell wall biosynthesis